jgi:tetratricopeptide (TPR) repeat protein
MQLSDQRFFTRWRLGFLAVCLIACLVYLPALSGLPIWEDNILLNGSAIGGGQSWVRCFTQPFLSNYYRPLVSFAFFLELRLWGNESMFLFHQTNILLHVFATAAIIQVLRAAFSDRRIALAGGLLFAVQPVQVSGVAWLGGRADPMCTLWLSLFSWAIVRAAQTTGRARTWRVAAATLAYAAAVLTKEQALFILPLVPLAFRCFAPAGQTNPRGAGWRSCVPFAIVAAAFVTAWFIFVPPHARHLTSGLMERFDLAGHTLTYYTLVLLSPTPQWIHTMSLGGLDRSGLWTAVLGYVVLGLCLYQGMRWLRSCPPAAWFMGLILLAILPISNLLPLPSIVVTPYRGGMAGVGVAALLAYAILVAAPQAAARFDTSRLLRGALGMGYAVLCLGVTVWSAGRWQNEVKIATTCLRYDQDTIFIRYNLSAAYMGDQKPQLAAEQMEALLGRLFGPTSWQSPVGAVKALRANPRILDFVHANLGYIAEPDRCIADLYSRLGSARIAAGDMKRAYNAFEVGAAIDPRHYEANLGLARCAFKAGDIATAKECLSKAIAGDPNQVEAHSLLAEILGKENQWGGRRSELETCVRLNPWLGPVYVDLADVQTKLKDYTAARATLNAALNKSICDPDLIHHKIASLDLLVRQ